MTHPVDEDVLEQLCVWVSHLDEAIHNLPTTQLLHHLLNITLCTQTQELARICATVTCSQ